MVRGIAAFKAAQSVADYQDAVTEFTQATLAAPWYGDAYYNLGVAQDKAEQYDSALRSLKLALLASPGSKDIKDLTYKVEYRAEQANSPEGKAYAEYGPAQQQFAALMQKLDGTVFLQEEITSSLHFFRELHFYKVGRYHLLTCDLREMSDNLDAFPGQDPHGAWENEHIGDYILPTSGRDKNAGGFILFRPDSGQEFIQGCMPGAGRLSADGSTIDQINLYRSTGDVMSVWHRQ
jgi:tetratricopeptide (TPR) repeat protein